MAGQKGWTSMTNNESAATARLPSSSSSTRPIAPSHLLERNLHGGMGVPGEKGRAKGARETERVSRPRGFSRRFTGKPRFPPYRQDTARKTTRNVVPLRSLALSPRKKGKKGKEKKGGGSIVSFDRVLEHGVAGNCSMRKKIKKDNHTPSFPSPFLPSFSQRGTKTRGGFLLCHPFSPSTFDSAFFYVPHPPPPLLWPYTRILIFLPIFDPLSPSPPPSSPFAWQHVTYVP